MKRIALVILFAALPAYGADDCHVLCIAKREAVRYVRDAKSLATAPLQSHFESFPSGHATNAFAFATAIAGHYDGRVVPTIVYTIATGVAVSRVNDHDHFPSDVLAGALIGRGIAKGILARHTGSKVS